MDLYEALKSGIDEEELLENFYKDLEEATSRIKEEKEKAAAREKEEKERAEKEKKARLAEYRFRVAAALCDYLNLGLNILEPGDFISQAELEEILEEFEKNLEFLSNIRIFSKNFDKNKKFKIGANIFECFKDFNDDEIIQNFIKSL